jgi:hypothetical protein
MRAYTPGGRFDADFETDEILFGIDTDLKNPVGTFAYWYIYDPVNTVLDNIYDVGRDSSNALGGKVWTGPYEVPVVRAVISQGNVNTSAVGYYNSDTLHLTFNIEDLQKISPNVIANPDFQNRGRLVWKNQVYRPYSVQQRGIIADRFTLIVADCLQVMPEEMVNDPQFLAYATPTAGVVEDPNVLTFPPYPVTVNAIPSVELIDGGNP